MSRYFLFGLAVIAAVGLGFWPESIIAQQRALKEQLLGSWELAAVTGERPDGSTFQPFGANPKGIIIFASDGHFSLFQSSANVPRIASNDRAKATPEEATT